jgi:hypothetical protein
MPRGKHLTIDEKAVIIAKRAMKKSFRTIAREVNRDTTTVFTVCKNQNKNPTERNTILSIREKVIAALNEKGLNDIGYAEKCIELLNCKKYQLSPDGSLDLVPDNQTQAKVLNTVKDIMGLDAPHQEERKVTIELSPSEYDEIMIIRRRHQLDK